MQNTKEKSRITAKKLISLFLSFIMLFSITAGLDLSTYAETSGDYEYQLLDNGTAEITEYKGSEVNLTIPSKLDGHTVTSIGANSFSFCDSLQSVTIPEGVTIINGQAFGYCYNLQSVKIPSTVKTIEWRTFYSCESLKSISISSAVTKIGEEAFGDCESLASINVDSANKNYCSQDGILFNINKTELIQFPAANTQTTYTVPSSVTSIGDGAFNNCVNLTSVVIHDNVKNLGKRLFYSCDNLASVKLPNGITEIKNDTFEFCGKLASITIPNTVTKIGNEAFGFCSSLTSVVIPDSVKEIGDSAFYYCENLADITLPKDVVLGDEAFGATAYYKNDNNYENGILYIANNLVKAKSDVVKGECAIKSGVKFIDSNAFEQCAELTAVTIPNSVTSIGDSAFSECTALTSVTIPDSVTKIGANAFGGCTALASIKMGSGVTQIGYDAFNETAYYNNANNWENDVLYVGDCLIEAKKTISGNCNIKSGTRIVVSSAFSECEKLTGVTVPDSVIILGDSAFYGCSALTSAKLGNGIKEIEYGVFFYCEALKDIVIPNGVTKLGDNSFEFCTSLASITIPKSVTSVGSWAFCNCTALKDVYYGGTKADWEKIEIGQVNEYLQKATIHYTTGTCTHSYQNVVTKATLSKNGKITPTCTLCGATKTATTIYYPKTITLSTVTYTYDGEAKKPAVRVVDANGKVIPDSNYTVNMPDAVEPEKYTVAVTFNGDYYTGTKNLEFSIKPRTTSISVKAIKAGFTVNWEKREETTGYQLQYATRSDFKNAATVYAGSTNATSKTVTGRAIDAKYYVRVRTYKNIGSGEYVYGNWSSAASVVTLGKPSPTTITGVDSVVGGFTVKWEKIGETTGYQLQYATRSDFSNAATIYAGPTNATSKTVTGRANGARYYVRVRTYRNIDGEYVYGDWSDAKNVVTPSKPATTSITSVSAGRGSFTVNWKKTNDTTGYQLQYATRSDFSNAATIYAGPKNSSSKTVTGRARNARYYVRIRTYKNIDGKYLYGSWSSAKNVTTR